MSVQKQFGVASELKALYRVYLLLVVLGGFLWWMIPTVAVALISFELPIGMVIALSLFAPLIIIVGFAWYWIPRFCSSISYTLEDDEIVVAKGVWWKTKSFVPYNRVTNVHIDQGPLSRRFGLGALSIQTAGFSGASSGGYKVAEAVILGIRNFEEVKDTIMRFVKGVKPEAVEAAAEAKAPTDLNMEILVELRKIRKALEK